MHLLPLGSFQSASWGRSSSLLHRGPKAAFPSWQWHQELAKLGHIYSYVAHPSCQASCTVLTLIETNMITELSLWYIWLFGCCFRNENCYWLTEQDRCYLRSTGAALQTQVCGWASSKEILAFALPKTQLGCTTRFLGLHSKGRAVNLPYDWCTV